MKTTFKDTGALDSEFSGRATWIPMVFEILIKMRRRIANNKKRRRWGQGRGNTKRGKLQFVKDKRHAVTVTREVPPVPCAKNCLLQFAAILTKCKFIQALLHQISTVYNSC